MQVDAGPKCEVNSRLGKARLSTSDGTAAPEARNRAIWRPQCGFTPDDRLAGCEFPDSITTHPIPNFHQTHPGEPPSIQNDASEPAGHRHRHNRNRVAVLSHHTAATPKNPRQHPLLFRPDTKNPTIRPLRPNQSTDDTFLPSCTRPSVDRANRHHSVAE